MAVLINWIRKELAEGNPLLGLLRLNENFKGDSPIRKAILTNFCKKTSDSRVNEIIEKLLLGLRCCELTDEEKREIMLYKKSVSIRSSKLIPTNIASRLKSRNVESHPRRAFRASIRVSNLS